MMSFLYSVLLLIQTAFCEHGLNCVNLSRKHKEAHLDINQFLIFGFLRFSVT